MLRRLFALFSRRRLEREFDSEIENHIALLHERYLRQGMTPSEAASMARRRFGGVTQLRESRRDHNGFPRLENLLRDFRYAARALARSPGYTLVAVLSLALGIGANTAIYSLINAVLLRALPVPGAARLVVFGIPSLDGGEVRFNHSFSYSMYRHFREGSHLLESVIAFRTHPFSVAIAGQTERVTGAMISDNYFAALGVRPALGSGFDLPGETAVIGYSFWQRRFGGSPSALGRTIEINGHPFTIAGVAPEGFTGTDTGSAVDVFGPMASETILMPEVPNGLEGRYNQWLRIMGRLRPDTDAPQAEAEQTVLLQQFYQADFERMNAGEQRRRTLRARRIALVPGAAGMPGLRRAQGPLLAVLMVVVAVVLLISCANIANLALARAAGRQREIAVRLALGASRGRLFSLLLAESLTIAWAGTLLGLVLARWARDLLVHALLPTESLDVSLDARVFAFAVLVGLAAGVLFGLGPALQSGRAAWGQSPTRAVTRLRSALVVAQVALSVLLLIAAGLFLRTLVNLRSVDPGFSRQSILLAETDPGLNGYARDRAIAFHENLLAAVRDLPGVRTASLAECGPLESHSFWNIAGVAGRKLAPNESHESQVTRVAPGYFDSVGIRILLGRDLAERDTAGAPAVALVNQTFARQYLPNDAPLGKRIHLSQNDAGVEIVGLVQDSRYTGLREAPEPMLYVPYRQFRPFGGMVLHARLSGSPDPVIAGVRDSVRRLDPNMPLYNVRTIEEQIGRMLAGENLMATVAGLFGFLALALSAAGVYGVMAYAVSRRTREVGIRLSLGAESRSIVRLMLRDAALWIAGGIAIGVPAAYLLARLAASRFFGVSPGDTVSIAAAIAVLSLVGFAAAWIPARRAAQVDPAAALRTD